MLSESGQGISSWSWSWWISRGPMNLWYTIYPTQGLTSINLNRWCSHFLQAGPHFIYPHITTRTTNFLRWSSKPYPFSNMVQIKIAAVFLLFSAAAITPAVSLPIGIKDSTTLTAQGPPGSLSPSSPSQSRDSTGSQPPWLYFNN